MSNEKKDTMQSHQMQSRKNGDLGVLQMTLNPTFITLKLFLTLLSYPKMGDSLWSWNRHNRFHKAGKTVTMFLLNAPPFSALFPTL